MSFNQKATVFLVIQIHVLQITSYAIDMRDAKVFEIALDDANYDEESENEMIQPEDVANLKPLAEDEGRYGPLHSHVKYYNEHNAESGKQYSDILLYLRSHTKEIFNLGQENKPFIAGFKHNLDKYFFKVTKQTIEVTSTKTINPTDERTKRRAQNFERLQNYRKIIETNVAPDKGIKDIRVKRKEAANRYEAAPNEEMDFFQMIRDRRDVVTGETGMMEYFTKMSEARTRYDLDQYDEGTTSEATKNIPEQSSISGRSVLTDDENSYEESYDYERFKIEYEHQLEYDMKEGKVLNYTEKGESKGTLKEALKRIVDLKPPKNCTKEELSQIGIKAIECLLYEYQRTRDITTAKIILSRTWLVVRVWLLIYICLAIPCWCQRGWCCCCFRCKFCFPRKRIVSVKQYYAMNPPGILMKDLKKEKDAKESKYEATEYEHDAYKTLEAAIRNI